MMRMHIGYKICHFLHTNMTRKTKITSRTTGARGYEFELFLSIFNYIEQFCQSLLSILLTRFISVYFEMSWSISVYLGISIYNSVYLGLS